MFSKEKQELTPKDIETIIGPSIKVKGNFHGQGNIVIEGIVEGSVKTNKMLFVNHKAKVLASIIAKDAKIGGEITGKIKIQGYVEITSTAKIFGDIEANEISIERGAVINGRCSTVAAPSPEKELKEKIETEPES